MHKLSEYCDFITFLGFAQSLQIDFLPITWQHGLEIIGEGATGEIREALLDKSTSFAFKQRLFKESFSLEELKGQILPTLVAEISTLYIPSIRYCPSIIDLVGVCWEIYCEDEYALSRDEPVDFSKAAVIPVLVFQKSKFGDLHTFMMHDAWCREDLELRRETPSLHRSRRGNLRNACTRYVSSLQIDAADSGL